MRGAAGNSPGDGCRPDAGSTLIEVLIALVITSSAIFVLVGGMTTLFGSSIQNRQSTNAGIVVRDYAEAVVVAVAQASTDAVAAGSPLTWCSSSYLIAFTAPSGSGYTLNAPVYGACPTSDGIAAQFQTVVLSVAAPNGATETLHIVVRES